MTFMSDVHSQATAAAAARRKVLASLGTADTFFRYLTLSSAYLVLAILGAIFVSLILGGSLAFQTFGFSFLTREVWNPVTEQFGALAPIYGTVITSAIAMLVAVPISIGIAVFLTELCPMPLRRPIGIAIELLAGVPSIIYGIWGLFFFAPVIQQYVQPELIAFFKPIPVLNQLFAGPPYGIGILTSALILAMMVLPFITAAGPEGSGLRHGMDDPRGRRQRRHSVYACRHHRRRDAGPRPRPRRDHGRHLRDRQRPPDLSVDPGSRNDNLGDHR